MASDATPKPPIEAYVAAIEAAIANRELAAAGSHLIDFARDWSPKRRPDAVIIRGSITEWEEAERVNRTPKKSFEDLAFAVLALAEVIKADFHGSHQRLESDRKVVSTFASGSPIGISSEDDLDRSRKEYWRARREQDALAGREITAVRCKSIRYESDSFTLEVPPIELNVAEILGVIGLNGSGKSTLLRILAGRLASSSGILEYPIISKERLDWIKIKRSIEYLPSERYHYAGTVRALLELAASWSGLRGSENEEWVDFLVARYGLTSFQGHAYHALSSGFQLRFELVRALLSRPKILILDEPLANLDVQTQGTFLADVLSIARAVSDPTSVIMSSHHITEVDAIADKIVVLQHGHTAFYGAVEEIPKAIGGSLFELGTESSRSHLESVLRQLGRFRIKRNGFKYLIRSSYPVDSSQFASSVLQSGVTVNSFTDLSKSARQFLETF